MSSYKPIAFLLIACLLLLLPHEHYAQENEVFYYNVQRLIDKGRIKKANNRCRRNLNKVKRVHGVNSLEYLRSVISYSRTTDLVGEVKLSRDFYLEASNLLERYYTPNELYYDCVAEFLNYQIQIHDFTKVIERSKKILKRQDIATHQRIKISIALARAYSAAAYFSKSDSVISSVDTLVLDERFPKSELRLAKQFDIKGRTAYVRSYDHFFKYLYAKTELNILRGDKESSDSLINYYRGFFDRKFGKRSYYSTLFYELDAEYSLYFNDKETSLKSAHEFYRRAKMPILGPGISSAAPLMLDYREILSDLYLENKNLHQAQRMINLLYRKSFRYGNRDHLNYLPYLRASVRRWIYRGNLKAASKRVNDIIRIDKTLPRYHPEKIKNRNILYVYYILSGNYEKAYAALNQINSIKEYQLPEGSPALVASRINIIKHELEYEFKTEQADTALFDSDINKLTKEFNQYHPEYLNYLNTLGRYYYLNDNFEKTIKYYSAALRYINEKYGQYSLEFVGQLNLIGSIFLQKNEFEEAFERLELAYNIASIEFPYSVEYAGILQNLADYYLHKGDIAKVDDLINRAEKVYNRFKSGSDIELISDADQKAEFYIKTGRSSTAEKLLQEIIQVKEEQLGSEHVMLANSYTLMGSALNDQGKFVKAENYARKAELIYENSYGRESLVYLKTTSLIAQIYQSLGDYQRAVEQWNNVIRYQRVSLGYLNPEVAFTLINRAECYILSDQYSSAEDDLNKAKEILKQNQQREANSLVALWMEKQSLLEKNRKNYSQALAYLDSSNTYYLNTYGKKSVFTARIEIEKGKINLLNEEYDIASEQFKSASRLYKKIYSKNHPQKLRSDFYLSKTYYNAGRPTKAMVVQEDVNDRYIDFLSDDYRFLSQSERGSYWYLIKDNFNHYYELSFSEKSNSDLEKVLDYRLNTKSILLSSSVRMRKALLGSSDTLLKSKMAEWLELKSQLIYLRSLPPEDRELSELNKIKEQINRTEKVLLANSEMFRYQKNNYVAYKDLKDILDKGEWAVEIIRYSIQDSARYAAIIINPNLKEPQLIHFKEGDDLESKYYSYYKNALRLNTRDPYSYSKFWKAIDTLIPNGARVYLSPDGVYHQINPETMLDDEGNIILRKYSITLVNNLKDIVRRTGFNENIGTLPKAVLLGNPEFYPNSKPGLIDATIERYPPLKESGEEVRQIGAMLKKSGWNTTILTDEEASEDRMERLNNASVIHFATHGYFYNPDKSNRVLEQDPLLQSGLLLKNGGELLQNNVFPYINRENGILTAEEIVSLNLTNCRLVVLSACETGLGSISYGQGVFGLQRSFITAGADAVIMSLFKINDVVTKEFLISFYENWLSEGDPELALRKSKLEFQEKYGNPYWWGAFVLITY